MAISYKDVVPWGRSFGEYRNMFNLTDADLNKKILGCGDGPASFNMEMTEKGKHVVSIDPIYQFSTAQLRERLDETYDDVIGQTEKNKEKFIWKEIPSVEALGEIRMSAMKQFLADFEQGKSEKRYIYAELPVISFEDNTFDLALSSHFLFLYSDNLSLDFHLESIREMCRVAKEIRIFPLLDVNANRSSYVDSIKEEFAGEKRAVSVIEEKVPYEFQKNGNTMLKISSGS
ncbi:MAG: class I SAM-dependent methyltransferase [bacterium]|nr:class I SAM-dependent methyltransferase [bacterium]